MLALSTGCATGSLGSFIHGTRDRLKNISDTQLEKIPEIVASSLASKLGIIVRDLRNESGLSQERYAAKCGLHRTYIGSIERGEKTVTIETASKLAQAFGISLSQLLERLETQKNGDGEFIYSKSECRSP